VTRVVGLPLAAAGTVVALGTLGGLAVPPAAGRLVDRVGPRRVVICAELLQALGAVALAADFYLSGMSVYVLEALHAEPWLPGATLALYTGLNSLGGTAALWATRRMRRTTAMAWGAALYAAWCGVSVAAVAIPPRWRAADLLARQCAQAGIGAAARGGRAVGGRGVIVSAGRGRREARPPRAGRSRPGWPRAGACPGRSPRRSA
jgi:MFS family permease